MPRVPSRRAIVAGLSAAALLPRPLRGASANVTVFAASSLNEALARVADAWSRETGHVVVRSHAGSSTLARQIQEGAPADIFIPASPDWMDALEASGDLRKGTRRVILGNALVLVAHGQNRPPVTIDPSLDLAGMLGDGRLAMAQVDSVPAGVYGKAALSALGLWEKVAARVAQADSVRAAIVFVARGEAPLGIVFATDAALEARVSILATFPPETHPPILYPAAITRQSRSPVAQAFLDYLTSDAARMIWRHFGFRLPE